MRIANRLVAFIVAAALVATGVIVIVEVIAARAGAAPVIIGWHSILRWGRYNTWNATSVEVACVICSVAGLLLLVPQLRRRRPTRLSVTSAEGTDAALTRKGVAGAVRGAVNEVEGVTDSRVKVTHRAIIVKASSSAATAEIARTMRPAARAAAEHLIEALQLTSERRLKVAVDTRKGSAE